MRYLAECKPPRRPQTAPMSVGSAFDAKVKSFLFERLFGKTPEWSFTRLFEDQVQPHVRDAALKTVPVTWDLYKSSGALAELLLQLDKSILAPHFETRITKTIYFSDGEVTIMGVPDLMFQTGDCLVILDWKVNGFYSSASPRKGYVLCLPDRVSHNDVVLVDHYGVKMISAWFNDLYEDWARQLSTYTWLMGWPVGNRSLLMIHQLAFGRKPRVAIHAGLCEPNFQEKLYDEYLALWRGLEEGTLFTEPEAERLNAVAATFMGDDDESRIYRELTGRG